VPAEPSDAGRVEPQTVPLSSGAGASATENAITIARTR
jgi:hypothetical protein